ncbi:MAG: DUF1501 domain-containing protein [Gammaproteobacteria bacterium]|nr:DUF1501 domain-containing protein [Gammaproteobacteria bacterium]
MRKISLNRRQILKGLAGAGATTLALPRWAQADSLENQSDRILVVVELSGGNDGLNTVVPYADDAYYRHRPTLGLRPDAVRKLDDHFGLNPGALGFERLWQSGDLAIVHGCGYAQPSFSHFTSMAYWHTGAPHSGSEFGWMGRLADAMAPEPRANLLISVGASQSLAVKSAVHTPVVFDDPERFQRNAMIQSRLAMESIPEQPPGNSTHEFLNSVARSAVESSGLIRRAWAEYQTPVDYGIQPIDLPKVAACIAAGLPTRLYHVSFRNNAFDTHVQQPALHRRLLSYACDGIHGFVRDMERIGQADRVVVLVYSEFGRRVPENANQGTDHGSANAVFLAGKPVKGGHYGEPVDLVNLDEGDNLKYTTDFRRVYATAIDRWLQLGAAAQVLHGEFPTFDAFT